MKSGHTITETKKQPGYTQAVEHIRYILDGYELFTFNMTHAPNPDNPDIAVIKDFERLLYHRFLRKEGTVWYADVAANPFPEELPVVGDYIEGAKKTITVNAYERDPEARRACINNHGAYLWRSCTGELSKQNDLVRLTYALETAKDMHWNYLAAERSRVVRS